MFDSGQSRLPSSPVTLVLSSGSPCDGLVRLRLRPASPQTPTTSASAISNAYSCADDDDEDRHTYLAAAAAQRALILRIEAVLPDARLQAVMDASLRPDGFVTLFCRKVRLSSAIRGAAAVSAVDCKQLLCTRSASMHMHKHTT